MRAHAGWAVLLFLSSGCAVSSSRSVVASVPMYSAGEWQAMNADATVPEIPDHAVVASFDADAFEDYSSVPAHYPVSISRLEKPDDFQRTGSLGSSRFSMHIHTHSFHMHMHH